MDLSDGIGCSISLHSYLSILVDSSLNNPSLLLEIISYTSLDPFIFIHPQFLLEKLIILFLEL